MKNHEPLNQKYLFGLNKHLLKFIGMYNSKILPNKLLISGPKGIGKSTLAYHLINYILSYNDEYKYDIDNFSINDESPVFKTILNKSNPNLITIDINLDKKSIDINQIRELIVNLNKSSLNSKPRFVLIDNIEFLNKNSINALLKTLEEPNQNIYFMLINSNKKVPSTLTSRCINYKINLTNKESLEITNHLLGEKLENLINGDLIDYYVTPGYIYNLIIFAKKNKYNLLDLNLKEFLKIVIKEKHYKKDSIMNLMIFNLLEFYFRKLNLSFSNKINEKYSYFIKRIFEMRTFNLDDESLFMEFEDEFLNG